MVRFHPKSNNLNFTDFQNFSGRDDPWFCFKCSSDILPFRKLKNQSFDSFILPFTEASSNPHDNKENYKPPPNFSLLFNEFNDLSAASNVTNPANVISCKNYDIDKI